MRQLVFLSADVYCQILNNHQNAESSYLYSNGKKEKQARCQRDKDRVCKRRQVAENRVASVVKMAVGE